MNQVSLDKADQAHSTLSPTKTAQQATRILSGISDTARPAFLILHNADHSLQESSLGQG